MIRLKGEQPVYFDCDDTLVMWVNPFHWEEGSVHFKNSGVDYYLHPHAAHIAHLKDHKKQGHTVIVWSAGGEDWAAEVVRGLGLEEFVDATIGKPILYYDDLPHNEVLPEDKRVYNRYMGPIVLSKKGYNG